MTLPAKVKIVEVGPRDGLQNEKETIPAEIKIALVERLTDAGCINIEAASFVSPKWVPQLATSNEDMAGIQRKPVVIYSVLQPNMTGFEAAIAAGADEGARAGDDLRLHPEVAPGIAMRLRAEEAAAALARVLCVHEPSRLGSGEHARAAAGTRHTPTQQPAPLDTTDSDPASREA